MRAFDYQLKKKPFYYTMLFSSSDLKELSKNLILIAAHSAGFLIGGVITKVLENEKDIQILYSRLKRCENAVN